MNTNTTQPVRKVMSLLSYTALTMLVGAFALMLISALHPDVRAQVRGALVHDSRTIVSTVTGQLTTGGAQHTVVKVKTRNAIFLEIYENQKDGASRLVEKIELADKKDGYFNFNGQATNLAISDIDNDGVPEILAPSFDQNLVGHINIYRYNQSANGFQRVLR